MDITHLLERSASSHTHLCPRQILGVRMGLAGMRSLGFLTPPGKKELLVIAETDGCFVDGLTASTECTVGHRTLRVEDYGKVAATFVDTRTGAAMRLAPVPDIRDRALLYAPREHRHYFSQMLAYQTMPEEVMFTQQAVMLNTPVEQIISRPGLRVTCAACGEEIMNQREVVQDVVTLCISCAHGGYYHTEREVIGAFGLRSEAVLSR